MADEKNGQAGVDMVLDMSKIEAAGTTGSTNKQTDDKEITKELYVNIGRHRVMIFKTFDEAVADYVDHEKEYKKVYHFIFGYLRSHEAYQALLIEPHVIWRRAYEMAKGEKND